MFIEDRREPTQLISPGEVCLKSACFVSCQAGVAVRETAGTLHHGWRAAALMAGTPRST